MVSRGIDISHHQGSVDWRALKSKHGLTWGACKATEGATFTDDRFAANWANMKAAGLVRMAYHFARPESSSGSSQARRFLAVVKPVKGDVLCLDLEESALSQARTNLWAREFAQVLRALAPDCTTVLYAGGYSQNGSGAGLSAFFDYWWYARYPYDNHPPLPAWPTSIGTVSGNTTGWPAPHIWQWTSKLSPGYDANVSTITAAQLSTKAAQPQEDDMPTPDDLFTWDGFKAPARTDTTKNPNWTLESYIPAIGEWVLQCRDLMQAQATALADLKAEVDALKSGTPIKASGTATVQVEVDLTPSP